MSKIATIPVFSSIVAILFFLNCQRWDYIKEDLYYKSDHHWTTRGAFLAFQTMVDKLKKDGVLLENYNYYTDINGSLTVSYIKITLQAL